MTRAGRRTASARRRARGVRPRCRPLVDRLLAPGPVRARLDEVATRVPFETSLELVVREMLSLRRPQQVGGPGRLLDDRPALRRLAQRVAFTDLDDLRAGGSLPDGGRRLARPVRRERRRLRRPVCLVRVVVRGKRSPRRARRRRHRRAAGAAGGGRAAPAGHGAPDVGRFRAVHRRRDRASAVCTLRPAGGDAAYVISYDDARCAGEANIRVAFVTPQGHLRIAFHRGGFA